MCYRALQRDRDYAAHKVLELCQEKAACGLGSRPLTGSRFTSSAAWLLAAAGCLLPAGCSWCNGAAPCWSRRHTAAPASCLLPLRRWPSPPPPPRHQTPHRRGSAGALADRQADGPKQPLRSVCTTMSAPLSPPLLLLLLLAALASCANALRNGLALTPPRGFSTWQQWPDVRSPPPSTCPPSMC
jgi:hypothetical protein